MKIKLILIFYNFFLILNKPLDINIDTDTDINIDKNNNVNENPVIKISDKDKEDFEMYQQLINTPASLQFFTGVGSIQQAITKEINKNYNWNNDNIEKRNFINKIDKKNSSTLININQLELSQKNLSLKLDNDTYAQIICEGSKYWIECEPHQLINVVNTFWGRYENNMCINSSKYIFDQKENICEAKSPSIEKNIKNFCQNEIKCLIHANETFLSKWDCHNIPKYLQITYQCLHSESRIKTNVI